jgi:hypothetical protein
MFAPSVSYRQVGSDLDTDLRVLSAIKGNNVTSRVQYVHSHHSLSSLPLH